MTTTIWTGPRSRLRRPVSTTRRKGRPTISCPSASLGHQSSLLDCTDSPDVRETCELSFVYAYPAGLSTYIDAKRTMPCNDPYATCYLTIFPLSILSNLETTRPRRPCFVRYRIPTSDDERQSAMFIATRWSEGQLTGTTQSLQPHCTPAQS